MNVPNILTMLRVVLAIAVFVFCAVGNWDLCLLFFVVASLTDFVDGWWARKFGQVTVFGRIMDPFADKFLICGVFICLVALPEMGRSPNVPSWLMLQPWMVIVIVARELLITSLRAVVEKGGGDFSAKWIGKWKMGFQCVAIIACFLYMAMGAESWYKVSQELMRDPSGFQPTQTMLAHWNGGKICGVFDAVLPFQWRAAVFYTMLVSLWATVGITLYSGVVYCINAAKTIRAQK